MKLSTPDLELLITNLKAFIVKVEESNEYQEYNMYSIDKCIYAKIMKNLWCPSSISLMLLNKDYLEIEDGKLFNKAFSLFTERPFDDKGYDYFHLTKQQWLEVANKVVLKLEKKLWKRQAKAVQKSMDTDLVV